MVRQAWPDRAVEYGHNDLCSILDSFIGLRVLLYHCQPSAYLKNVLGDYAGDGIRLMHPTHTREPVLRQHQLAAYSGCLPEAETGRGRQAGSWVNVQLAARRCLSQLMCDNRK